MDPHIWYHDLDQLVRAAIVRESSMHAALLIFVGYSLRVAATEWQKMAAYFDTLVGGDLLKSPSSTLLSPDKHDLLLFEDETFLRSRKYFWIVDAVTSFMEKISDAIDAWKRYRMDQVNPYLLSSDGYDARSFRLRLADAEAEVEKLEVVRNQLEKHLERTKLLRDGVSLNNAHELVH